MRIMYGLKIKINLWRCIFSQTTKSISKKSPPNLVTAAVASMMLLFTLPQAKWDLAVSVRAVWVHTTAKTDFPPFRIINLSLTKKSGSICQCVINPIKANSTKNFYTFSCDNFKTVQSFGVVQFFC